MKHFKSQRGFTLIELLICLAFVLVVVVGCVGVYVAWHFIAKFW